MGSLLNLAKKLKMAYIARMKSKFEASPTPHIRCVKPEKKPFYQTFLKMAPTPLEKPLHQRSNSQWRFDTSWSPTKQARKVGENGFTPFPYIKVLSKLLHWHWEATLPNIFLDGFSSTKKAASPKESLPKPFLEKPEPYQTSAMKFIATSQLA